MLSIVYLAVNEMPIVKETLQSIYSFFKGISEQFAHQHQIIVYTNFPKMFITPFLNKKIIIESVESTQLELWLGPREYIYRLKIMALIHCIDKYKTSVLFLDGDTIFIKPPTRLFDTLLSRDKVILHCIESSLIYRTQRIEARALKNPIHAQKMLFYKDLLEKKMISDGKDTYMLSSRMPQWNAGVIGLHKDNAYLLEKVLHLSDYIFENFQIRESEQIAFTCVFQNEKVVYGAEDIVFHYWFFKEARYMIENYYDVSVFDYPHEYMDNEVIEQIKKIKNWDIPLSILFKMIVCIFRKKWNNNLEMLITNIANDGFLKTIVFDDDYYYNSLECVMKYTGEDLS